jgi:hypothetical protein
MVAKIVFGTVLLLLLVLSVTNVAETSRLARRLDEIAKDVPTRGEVGTLRPLRIGATLAQRCTSCHSDRKFKEAYGAGPRELTDKVMAHPGGEGLGRPEAERVSAAMILTRCTGCHGEEVVGALALKSSEARLEYLRGKVREQRPLFETHEVRHVLWAVETLLGEPRADLAQAVAPPTPATPPTK